MMDFRARVIVAASLVGAMIAAAPGAVSVSSGAYVPGASARFNALSPMQSTTMAAYLPLIAQRSQAYPAPIGQIGGQALAVAVLGDYAYVADSFGGLWIMDIDAL